jgi:hypothetical protein
MRITSLIGILNPLDECGGPCHWFNPIFLPINNYLAELRDRYTPANPHEMQAK